MRSGELTGTRLELAEWGHPVVVDFLRELYAGRLGSTHPSLRALSLSHARFWRFLIVDDAERLAGARREVMSIARLAGLRQGALDEIDQEMLAELMDVVVARFLRTPAMARAYSQIVLGAAARLAALNARIAAPVA